MKIRNGFVSNSSSSSFIICKKACIKDREEIREYLKNNDTCVGYYENLNDGDGVFFEIKKTLRDKIIEHFDEIKDLFTIEDNFHYLNDETITSDMVGCTISDWSGMDGLGCPIFINGNDWEWDCRCGEEILNQIFDGILEEEDLESLLLTVSEESYEDQNWICK